MSDDLITVCIPTYRRPSQLLHAVHSCSIQDYRPIEIVIGDDSPTNDTEDLVATFVAPEGVSVRYVHNEPGLGQAANVNELFRRAGGKQLVLLHDDDVLVPGALRAMHAVFESRSDVVGVYGLQQVIADNGEIDAKKSEQLNVRYKRTKEFAGLRRDAVRSALWRQFPNDGYLVDTEAARSVGYRRFDEVGESCDTDFSIRLALASRGKAFYLIEQATCRYRLSRGALSGSRDISWRFYRYLLTLTDRLTKEEVAARDELLREIAAQALVENAVRGDRRAALGILLSGYYPIRRKLGFAKLLYHLGLIGFPQIDRWRRRPRAAMQ